MSPPPFRALPAAIDGYGPVDPYSGQGRIPAATPRQYAPVHAIGPRADKRLAGIEQAFDACGIGSGEIGRASCRERVLWVTGVQTCALPISPVRPGARHRPAGG